MLAIEQLRRRARQLKRETLALALACCDPRTPWLVRVLVGLIVAYALSPIDLIPDVVPVLGYLDDLILVPAGLALAIRLIPPDVLAACRARAAQIDSRPASRLGIALVVGIWVGAAALVLLLLAKAFDLLSR